MFKKLIESVKNVFAESIEEKIAREERNKRISNQKTLIENKTCPVCSGKLFDKGYISVSGTRAVAVSGITTYHGDYNMRYEGLVHVCATCGYVFLFADFNSEHKYEI